MTKIEEVARAVDPAEWKWIDKDPSTLGAKVRRENSFERARAAIEAMRGPTMMQEIEGKAALIQGRRIHGVDVCPSPCAVYVAMIDAALAEGPK